MLLHLDREYPVPKVGGVKHGVVRILAYSPVRIETLGEHVICSPTLKYGLRLLVEHGHTWGASFVGDSGVEYVPPDAIGGVGAAPLALTIYARGLLHLVHVPA